MTSNLPPNDPKVINDIVDKLKKQGIFDKFRKDCLADVDTRPAYQNLRQRVEVFVRRFLSNKKWTPELNKNKLRESLRKEITQAPMLSTGVGHIVEQVVNPKIYKVFKPEIDAVVCEFLGIDLHDREEKIRLRRELQRQQRQQELAQQQLDRESNANFNTMGVQAQQFSDGQNFGASSLPNMMDMAFNMSTMGPNMNLASAMGQSIPDQLAQTMQPNQLFPNMPPTMPNFALPPPGFGTTPHLPFNFTLPPPGPSQVPGSYAGMQQDFSTGSSFPQVPGMPNMSYADQINMMTSMASELQPSIPAYSMQGLTSMSTMASTMTSTLSSEQTIAAQASVSMEGVGISVMTQSSASSEQVPKYEPSEDKKIPEKKERKKKKVPTATLR